MRNRRRGLVAGRRGEIGGDHAFSCSSCASPLVAVSFCSASHSCIQEEKHAASSGRASRAPAAASIRFCRIFSACCSCHAVQPRLVRWCCNMQIPRPRDKPEANAPDACRTGVTIQV